MNKLIVIVIFAAFMQACTPKSYIVEGVVPDAVYDNPTVYMYDYETRKHVDTAPVINGKFKFTGSVDTAVIRGLEFNGLSADIILENGKISVNMDAPETVKGTPLNNEFSKYRKVMAAYRKTYLDRKDEIEHNDALDAKAKKKRLNENIKMYKLKADSVYSNVFNANKNNVVGTFALWDWANLLTSEQLDSVYAQAGEVVRNFKVLQKKINTNARIRQTAVGMPFVDFTIDNGNVDESQVSLSDYVGKGKYVLVDFWASTCGPCIAEMPVIAEIYSKYKGDKFEVLGIAVWEKHEASLAAIKKHKMVWPQIIDTGHIVSELYSFNSIPRIILFDPDGKIIARDLRGDGLKAKIAEIMQ